MAAGSMLQQGEQQRQQRRADKASMMANAAAIEHSPWTGMQTQMQGPKPTGGMGSVLGAGAQGAMMGAMFNQANPATPGQKPSIYKPKTVDEEQLLKGQYQGTSMPSTMNSRFSPWGGMINS
jgi:hypothetical protein